jgi:hypothetical protein
LIWVLRGLCNSTWAADQLVAAATIAKTNEMRQLLTGADQPAVRPTIRL